MNMVERQFAPGYTRNDAGWILFPRRDKELRLGLFFPEEVMLHPAKMNLYLLLAILEYVAEEGQTLLDPFGGTGTLMIAALRGMRVILIDIGKGYHKLQLQSLENLRVESGDAADLVTLLHGDCRFLLPIPCHHIITSPPYSNIMKVGSRKADEWVSKKHSYLFEDYSDDPRNIGRLNTFLYNQAMEKVYTLCYQSLLPGGTLTVVIKDRMVAGKRIYLSNWVERVCSKLGFRIERYKWLPPPSAFREERKSKGVEVIDDEDIIICRK